MFHNEQQRLHRGFWGIMLCLGQSAVVLRGVVQRDYRFSARQSDRIDLMRSTNSSHIKPSEGTERRARTSCRVETHY
jgi:hypothetical protein